MTSAVEKTKETYGRLDVLVNNGGYAVVGPIELASSEQLVNQYNTNLLGPIQMMQKVLPIMREQKSGTIVNVTSTAGVTPLALGSLYAGTKHGLEGVTESMAVEVAPFGIRARLVEPGIIQTDFGSRGLVSTKSDTVKAYDPLMANLMEVAAKTMTGGSTAEAIAAVLYEAATYEGHKIRFIAGEDAKEMIALRKTVSDEEFQKVPVENS